MLRLPAKAMLKGTVQRDGIQLAGDNAVSTAVEACSRRVEIAGDENRTLGGDGFVLGAMEQQRGAETALCVGLVVEMRVYKGKCRASAALALAVVDERESCAGAGADGACGGVLRVLVI